MQRANLRKGQLVASACFASRKLKTKVGLRSRYYLVFIRAKQLDRIVIADLCGYSVPANVQHALVATSKGKTAYTTSKANDKTKEFAIGASSERRTTCANGKPNSHTALWYRSGCYRASGTASNGRVHRRIRAYLEQTLEQVGVHSCYGWWATMF